MLTQSSHLAARLCMSLIRPEADQPVGFLALAAVLPGKVPGPAVETCQVVVADVDLLRAADRVRAGTDEADRGPIPASYVKRAAPLFLPG